MGLPLTSRLWQQEALEANLRGLFVSLRRKALSEVGSCVFYGIESSWLHKRRGLEVNGMGQREKSGGRTERKTQSKHLPLPG